MNQQDFLEEGGFHWPLESLGKGKDEGKGPKWKRVPKGTLAVKG